MKIRLNESAKIKLIMDGMDEKFLRDFNLETLNDIFEGPLSDVDGGVDITGAIARNGKEFVLPIFVLEIVI